MMSFAVVDVEVVFVVEKSVSAEEAVGMGLILMQMQ